MQRTVVVTGGASGIGFEVAKRFASEGDSVIVFDRDQANGEAAVAKLRDAGADAQFRLTDVSSGESVDVSVGWVVDTFGTIDVVVNSAGVLDLASIEDESEAAWDRVIDINLKGTFLVTQAAIRFMLKQRRAGSTGDVRREAAADVSGSKTGGRIINISSVAGRMGGIRTGPAYSASKAGVIGLTKAVARMVANEGITVNAVAPATTNTEMAKKFSEADVAVLLKSMPLGRLVEPSEVAEAVFYLASEKAAMITGAVLDINGGTFMG